MLTKLTMKSNSKYLLSNVKVIFASQSHIFQYSRISRQIRKTFCIISKPELCDVKTFASHLEFFCEYYTKALIWKYFLEHFNILLHLYESKYLTQTSMQHVPPLMFQTTVANNGLDFLIFLWLDMCRESKKKNQFKYF